MLYTGEDCCRRTEIQHKGANHSRSRLTYGLLLELTELRHEHGGRDKAGQDVRYRHNKTKQKSR